MSVFREEMPNFKNFSKNKWYEIAHQCRHVWSLRVCLLAWTLITLAACVSPQKPEPSFPPIPVGDEKESVDLKGLWHSLRMDRSHNELGFEEKSFNTCNVGFGYSPNRDCRYLIFVAINFRLQCRDSVGTVDLVSNSELKSLASKRIRWNLDSQQGYVMTNHEGFGQVLMTAPRSMRQQRLRLTAANDFLAMTAGEISRVVLPRPWCQ